MGNFYEDTTIFASTSSAASTGPPSSSSTEYEWRAPDGPESVDEAKELYTDLITMIGGFVADEIAPHCGGDRPRGRPELDEDGDVSSSRRGSARRSSARSRSSSCTA